METRVTYISEGSTYTSVMDLNTWFEKPETLSFDPLLPPEIGRSYLLLNLLLRHHDTIERKREKVDESTSEF